MVGKMRLHFVRMDANGFSMHGGRAGKIKLGARAPRAMRSPFAGTSNAGFRKASSRAFGGDKAERVSTDRRSTCPRSRLLLVLFLGEQEKYREKFLAADHTETLAIVTHGGVINILYHIIMSKEWSNKESPFPAAHCSLHILDTDTLRFEIKNG